MRRPARTLGWLTSRSVGATTRHHAGKECVMTIGSHPGAKRRRIVSSPAAERRRFGTPAPAQQRWPGLATPRGRSGAALVRALFRGCQPTRCAGGAARRSDHRPRRARLPGNAYSQLERVLPSARCRRGHRVRRVLHGWDWNTDDLAALLTVFAERITTLFRRGCSLAAALRARQPVEEENTIAARGRTFNGITTCRTNCSRFSSTRA